MAEIGRLRVAASAAALLAGIAGASAGPLTVPAVPEGASGIVAAQYYGYPPYPYRRPYGYYRPFYRPYGYGPGPRFYGPGVAKQRYRTRLDYCIKRPERC